MKIGIVSERLNRPLTGVTTYTQNLILELSTICPTEEICLIDYLNHNIFKDICHLIFLPFVRYFPKKSYLWNIYLNFKLRNYNSNIDIIHSPENAALFFRLEKQKKIITVHDSMYLFPESTSLITRLRYKFLLVKALKTADKIIAVSNCIKRDLINYLDISEDKIVVIHEAAEKRFKPANCKEINNVKLKYNLNFPYILYVGNIIKHKNIPTLIKAYYLIKKKGLKHKLVITGPKKNTYEEIFEIINQLNLQNDIIFTGYINEDLPAVYSAADIFVYPSLYEGFGLAPLEAMACGTPVIVSNVSSLPEVVGDAGILVEPFDINALATSIFDVLTKENLRKEISQKCLERSKLFSWEKCAMETLQVYKEVCK